MKLMDFIIQQMKDAVTYDEAGNLYIEWGKVPYLLYDYLCVPTIGLDGSTSFVSREVFDEYNQFELVIPEGFEYDSIVRRPYYRMRGKSVTEEQVFDIIRKTDSFFYEIDKIKQHEDFIGNLNFNNYLIDRNRYPFGHGWVHMDGTIGINDTCTKYPEIYEFIDECSNMLRSFPYLDLVIAITNWNEVPDEAWKDFESDVSQKSLYEYEGYDEKFYKAIDMGICIHDKTIEILKPADAVEKYKEYAAKYEKSREIYCSEYYHDNNIYQVSLDYLKKCIESYGLNADEELGKVQEYIWKGRIL